MTDDSYAKLSAIQARLLTVARMQPAIVSVRRGMRKRVVDTSDPATL